MVSRADFETFPLIAKLIRWGIDAHMGILFGWPNQLLMAGLGIVFLAVIFDRIAQALGRRMQASLHQEG